MRKLAVLLAGLVAWGVLSVPTLPQQKKGGEEETGPYEVEPKFPAPIAQPGYVWGSQGGVFAESPNRIFLLSRGYIKLPSPLPNGFNGAYGMIGSASRSEK